MFYHATSDVWSDLIQIGPRLQKIGTKSQAVPHKSPISPHRLACGFNVVPQRSTWDFIVASERRKVIAVVDDDPLAREALGSLLSSLGYRAELYASAAEFIATALTTEASCLLLDVQLGAMTGIELARHLISTGFSFPTIFMTGSRNESYQRDGVSLGCVDYLHKPFPASRLICAIDKALGALQQAQFNC